MHPRRSFLLATLAVSVSAALPASADDVGYSKLFFIQRSKNINEVHYDARVLKKDGALDAKEPMVGYWINKTTDNSRSPITLLQRVAYGYDVSSNGDGTWNLRLKAFSERKMTIVKVGDRFRVQTTIGGKPAYMTRLYVASDETGVIPKVLYVDVFGEAVEGGAVQERLTKS